MIVVDVLFRNTQSRVWCPPGLRPARRLLLADRRARREEGVNVLPNYLCVSWRHRCERYDKRWWDVMWHDVSSNRILVKLKLWESIIVFNNNFWSATNLCLLYASASVAGNSTFRGILFCNLSTPKPVISNFVTTGQIATIFFPIFPHNNMVTPTMFSVDKKQ